MTNPISRYPFTVNTPAGGGVGVEAAVSLKGTVEVCGFVRRGSFRRGGGHFAFPIMLCRSVIKM